MVSGWVSASFRPAMLRPRSRSTIASGNNGGEHRRHQVERGVQLCGAGERAWREARPVHFRAAAELSPDVGEPVGDRVFVERARAPVNEAGGRLARPALSAGS